MARLDHGTVEMDLAGEQVVLEPTLAALKGINRQFGSIRAAGQRVADLDLDAICAVIALGTGRKAKDAKDVEQGVYDEGLVNVVGPVTDYLVALMDPSGRGGDGEGKA